MSYVWRNYDPSTMTYIEKWLDDSAVKSTGLDEGFHVFYTYWANEEGFVEGENFWCKVVFEKDMPFAVIAFCHHEGIMLIMEIVVNPEYRGQSKGTKLLKEFLNDGKIIGKAIHKCEAVIFPDNIASQRAFEKAGFIYHHTHKDGNAMYYVYDDGSNESPPPVAANR